MLLVRAGSCGRRAGRGRHAALAAARVRATPSKASETAVSPGTTGARRAQEPRLQRGEGARTSSNAPSMRAAAQRSARGAGASMTSCMKFGSVSLFVKFGTTLV